MVLNGRRAWQIDMRQPIASAHNRVNFTHFATICNVPEIQPHLPHVIFVSAASLRVPDWHRICASLPPNVYLKRMPSAWNSADQQRVINRLIRASLEPFMARYQPIVYFDTAPAHMRPEVLHDLPGLGLWYALIPPRMTWMLQPLDSHAFQKYKWYLKTNFQNELAEGADRVAIEYMVGLVVRAIRYVLQRYRWAPAFEQNGLTGDHTKVSAYIRRHIQTEVLEPFSTDAPTMDALRLCWPRARVFPIAEVMDSLADADGYAADDEP